MPLDRREFIYKFVSGIGASLGLATVGFENPMHGVPPRVGPPGQLVRVKFIITENARMVMPDEHLQDIIAWKLLEARTAASQQGWNDWTETLYRTTEPYHDAEYFEFILEEKVDG